MSTAQHFGAKGDGRTDDTAALTHALRQGDGRLLLTRGDYVIRRPLSEPISYFETLRARNRQSGPRAPGWKRYFAKG